MAVLKHLEEIVMKGVAHLTLIDPDKQEPETAAEIAKSAIESGSDGIMVGGSTNSEGELLDRIVAQIKVEINSPVILFPSSEAGISKYADAIFFMSLMNSSDPYYITGAQRLGAPLVKKYGLEPIPMGYIIVEPGGAAGDIGQADLVSRSDPETAASYALAAQYLGMKLVYLEAGSGADDPVPPDMVEETKKVVDIPIAVGGGIRTPENVTELVKAGADITVTGTLAEKAGGVRDLCKIVSFLKRSFTKVDVSKRSCDSCGDFVPLWRVRRRIGHQYEQSLLCADCMKEEVNES